MTLQNVQGILAGKIAFRKTEIVNGVEQVGFANTISATDPDDPFPEAELLVKVVFELKK
jgi:hypothetical protein